jgi:hypothetical protein
MGELYLIFRLGNYPQPGGTRPKDAPPRLSGNRPSRGRRPGKPLKRHPNAACPDRAKPHHALRRAAFAGRQRVLGEPPAPRASSGRRWRRVEQGAGEKWRFFFLSFSFSYPSGREIRTSYGYEHNEDNTAGQRILPFPGKLCHLSAAHRNYGNNIHLTAISAQHICSLCSMVCT